MKKTTKSLLISALILFCAGLILALSSALFVKIKGIDAFGMTHPEGTVESVSVSIDEILVKSENSNYVKKLTDKKFIRIQVDSFAGNIVIQRGNETKLELTKADLSNLTYEVIGETLMVKEINPVGFMGIFLDSEGLSFHGLRQMFGGGNSLNSKRTITITVADGTALENLEINSGYGNITLDGITSNNFDINASAGNIDILNLSHSDAKLELEGDMTDVNIRDSVYSACSITTKIGNVSTQIPSELCKSTVISSWCGNVNVISDVPTKAFKLTLDTGIGSVIKNDMNLGNSFSDSSQLPNRITAETFLGNIHLSFSGYQEGNFVAVDKESETKETVEASTEETTTDSESV